MFFLYHNGKLFNVTKTFKVTVGEGKRNFRIEKNNYILVKQCIFFLPKLYRKPEAIGVVTYHQFKYKGHNHFDTIHHTERFLGVVTESSCRWTSHDSALLFGIWVNYGFVKHMLALKYLLRVFIFNKLLCIGREWKQESQKWSIYYSWGIWL